MLQETKCLKDSLRNLGTRYWRGSKTIGTDAKGVAGGMGIWWNAHEVFLSNFVATEFSITVEFHILGTRVRGCLTSVYEPFLASRKKAFVETMGTTKNKVGSRHWVMGGRLQHDYKSQREKRRSNIPQ